MHDFEQHVNRFLLLIILSNTIWTRFDGKKQLPCFVVAIVICYVFAAITTWVTKKQKEII